MTRLTARRGLLALALVVCRPAGRTRRPVQPPVPVTAAVAERRAVPFELAATGTVEPIQTVAVQPQVSGPIVRIAFTRGPGGDEGAGALRDRPPALPGRAGAGRGRPGAGQGPGRERRRRDASRYSELAEKEYVTAQQYEQVAHRRRGRRRRTWPASQAAVEQARLNLQYATIRAPIAGRTGSLRVREGNLVRTTDAHAAGHHQPDPSDPGRGSPCPRRNLPLIQQHRGETLAVRAAPVSGGTPERRHAGLRGQRGGHHHRDHPAQGLLSQRRRRALAGRVRERAAPALRRHRTRWWCRPPRWSRASRGASCS